MQPMNNDKVAVAVRTSINAIATTKQNFLIIVNLRSTHQLKTQSTYYRPNVPLQWHKKLICKIYK